MRCLTLSPVVIAAPARSPPPLSAHAHTDPAAPRVIAAPTRSRDGAGDGGDGCASLRRGFRRRGVRGRRGWASGAAAGWRGVEMARGAEAGEAVVRRGA